MTFIEHGLYGGAIVYSSNPHLFWLGVASGILPDIPPMALAVYENGIKKVLDRIIHSGSDDLPEYVYKIYDISHSFVTAIVLFIILFLVDKSLAILAVAYAFHILCDIPFHASRFSTRFLYPFSNFHIRGYSESKHKWVLVVQYPILAIIYWLLFKK